MMSDHVSGLRRLAVLMTVTAASAVMMTCTAQAATYGEIGHFGHLGTEAGQFTPTEEADGIGVNPENGDVYIVDKPSVRDEFRIQMFEPTEPGGTKYKAVASVAFKPKHSGEEFDEIEGVAVDPGSGRIYLLAAESRPESSKIDPNDYAVEAIYSFDATPVSGELVAAAGTEEGVLVNSTALAPTSQKLEVSLLEPKGITVNPTTHEIIVVGSEEPEKAGEPAEEPISIAERFSSAGAFEGRYVDSTNLLEDDGANPIVSDGEVYLQNAGTGEILELPEKFSASTTAPPKLFILPSPEQGLWNVPGVDVPELGDGAAAGPEGTIYLHAGIREQSVVGKFGFNYPGVVRYSAAGAEEGWTGGQQRIEEPGKEETPCAISLTNRPAALIAAGKNDTVFVYDDSVKIPRVVEFGAGGTGCRTSSATAIAATVRGNEVTEPVPFNEKVTFSSSVIEGNALSVQWVFGDGTEETINTPEYEKTTILHKFAASGKFKVKEIIHTDDLATPQLEKEIAITILAEKPKVAVVGVSPIAKTTATVKASVDPEGGEITNCHIDYGTSQGSLPSHAPCSPESGFKVQGTEVTGALQGLSEHTVYYFRVVATNSAGTTEGTVTTFSTHPVIPTVETGAASPGEHEATLKANVNPNGETIEKCYFQYGTTSSYGQEVPCASVPGKTAGKSPVTAVVEGLSANTTYHFRIVAYDLEGAQGGVAYGNDATFATNNQAAKEHEEKVAAEEAKAHEEQQQAEAAKKAAEEALAKKIAEEHAKTATTGPPPAVTPAVTFGGGSASVNPAGAFIVKISCPADAGSCTGTITLKTSRAVVASVGRSARAKAAILTVATGSYTVAGGKTATVTLHLTSKARTLLAHAHVISARATVTASDPSGGKYTALAALTLRPAKRHH